MCLTLDLTAKLVLVTNCKIKSWQIIVIMPKPTKRIIPPNEDTEIPSPELIWLIIVSIESIPIIT
jgi:hypothetical protein